MKELAEDFETTIIDWLKSDDENVTNLAYILAKKATTLQLLQTDVSDSTCPKCGCQINDPFTGTAIIHDVQACGGIIR